MPIHVAPVNRMFSQRLYSSTICLLDFPSGISIGFCSQFFDMSERPGSSSSCNSWGYHSDDGKYSSNGSTNNFGESFSTTDVVGAGVDFANKEICFTKNGEVSGKQQLTEYLSSPAHNYTSPGIIRDDKIKGKLFPVIGKRWDGVKICANFGRTEQDMEDFKYQPKKDRKVNFVRPVR